MFPVSLQRILLAAFAAASLNICPAGESDTTRDLSGDSFPRQLRPWRTDHAGASPYTVEPGHFEAEVTALRYGYSARDLSIPVITPFVIFKVPGRSTTDSWTYGAMVLKAGLMKNLDVEVSLTPWMTITHALTAKSTVLGGSPDEPPVIFPGINNRNTLSGFGDTIAELKLNVWGNDGGRTALAISGLVKFPTADRFMGNGWYEGGPGIEFSAGLPWAFELRLNSRATLFEPPGSHLEASFENLIGLVHPLNKTLEAYCVFDTFASSDSRADWSGRVRVGLNCRPCPNLELFIGSDFGVQPQTGTYGPFVGFSVLY